MMYQIIRVYDDQTCMTEHTPYIVAALEAAAIYLRDASCCSVKIWDEVAEEWVLDYYRP